MSGRDEQQDPPKPRLALRVGVTGKRYIPEGERGRVYQSLCDVFAALADTVAERHANAPDFFARERPLLRIISGMAEGADQLAAAAAIARYPQPHAVETRLAAILPFAKDEYKEDFWNQPVAQGEEPVRSKEEWEREVAHFEKLLKDPAVESVLQIDDEALRSKEQAIRDQAYPNLRDILLEHTDVLVAVSNQQNRGAGGTADVVGIAAKLNIPVIQISTLKPEVYVMRAAELDAPNQNPAEDDKQQVIPGAGLPAPLATLIGRMIDPPDSPADSSPRHESDPRPVRERLDEFFHEDVVTKHANPVFKALRAAATVIGEPRLSLVFRAIRAFSTRRKKYLKDLQDPVTAASGSTGALWSTRYDCFSDDAGAQARTVLARRYGWADTMAVRYADATRSAHIMIAFLGAVAVAFALVTLVLPQEPSWLALVIKIVALTAEVIVLLIAGQVFFRRARKERWHERMVEYRAVAELLRHERFIYALGAADRPGRPADRTFEEPDAWVGWYVRATLRELGFPSKAISHQARRDVLQAFLDDELNGNHGQIAYNKSLGHDFQTTDRRLEGLVGIAYWITVVVALGGIVILSTLGYMMWCTACAEAADHVVHLIKPWFTVIAALIPAVIAAVHGIRFQIDFKGTAMRAAATTRELYKVRDEVEKELKKGFPWPGRKQAIRLVRSANEAMSADVAGWSNSYRGRGPELG